ncbi:MAG: 2-oxoacid:acceptor oxidoreductase subunit alpha [Promethearchaeota archaeon]
MINDVFTIIIGGKAGQGTKKAGSVVAEIFANKGRYVFEMDDYMSLIKGGHNFSSISTSNRWISSHYMKADLIINLDKRSYDNHINHIAEDCIMVNNSDENYELEGINISMSSIAKNYPRPSLMLGVGAVAILAASIGFGKNKLNNIIEREYPRGIEDNISYANKIYDEIYPKIGGKFNLKDGDKKRTIISGNQAIALGAIAGGLNTYFAYPMTPSSSILHYLASLAEDFRLAVVHPENEIAVINMAIGSTYTGARAVIGTSGGGFALMEEGFSLAGMCEAPVLCILSMRPSPASGVPTYTGQSDLNFALNAGHGDFLRIVASPSTIEEAYYLTSEMLELVWKFQTPGILLTEKHLSESFMSVDINLEKSKFPKPELHHEGSYKRYLNTTSGISPLLFPPSREMIHWNSYEHDEMGITTENPEEITMMHNKRKRKSETINNYMENMKTINIYGKNEPIIFTWGSTTMSVLEALKYGNIECTVIQPIYLSPLPIWNLKKFKNKDNIVVELNSTGQLASLLKSKVGITPQAEINQYNGRPFDPIELSNILKEVIKNG